MHCPRVALFDLDETLAPSFQPPEKAISDKLVSLLEKISIGILTGASFNRIKSQFLPGMAGSKHLDRLYLFPNSAAECYLFREGRWHEEYNFQLSGEERTRIEKAIVESVRETGILKNATPKGPQLIDRSTQIAYAFLGINASDSEKHAWDPRGEKRSALLRTLEEKIPEFEILIGGLTSIDITRKGINKSYGINWLSTYLHIHTKDMFYLGDALYPGGNDQVVTSTGVSWHRTNSLEETAHVLDDLNTVCASQS